jgi:two-component system response regulator FixJ
MPHDSTVYVIDDDLAMRDSLDFLLTSAGFSVRLFETATDFRSALSALQPGCVVSDIRMPGLSGMDLLRETLASNPRHPVILMTGHGDIPLAVEAIKLGAVDFLEKPFEDGRLIDAIQTAFTIRDRTARNVEEVADLTSRIASLSGRERQVMDGLVAGLSNKVIAKEYDISPRTIEVYRANVMTKMNARGLSELVKMALRAELSKS